MELILDIFWEKRRVYVEWKQIVCAVLLALLIAGLYYYINVTSDYVEELMKEKAMASNDLTKMRSFADILLLPEENIKENIEEKESKSEPEDTIKEPNFAVSYGYTEPKAEKRIKSKKTAKKIETEAIGLNTVKKTEDHIENDTKAVKDVPVIDVITRDPGIGIEKNDDSKEKEKTDMVGTNPGRTETNTDSTDAEKTDVSDSDAEKTGTKPVDLWERFPGFLANDKGHIAGYTDASKLLKNHLLVLPFNPACTGIEKDALKGLEAEIHEIYIPANISYIAEGAFDELANLYYIEVAAENVRFYSENGILYYRNGKVAAYPNRLKMTGRKIVEEKSGKKGVKF